MEKSLLKFFAWTKLKIKLHLAINAIYFYEREIWWASLGANIGYEQDGKNDTFERPVLILKKFGKNILWALPLTSKNKRGEYYFQVDHNNKKYSIILSQLRLISSKRLLQKIRTLSRDDFKKIKENIKNLL